MVLLRSGLKLSIPVSVFCIGPFLQRPVFSESSRKFYEDESDVTTIPGTVIPSPASEVSTLGSNKLIGGISVRTTDGTESLFKSLRHTTNDVYEQALGYLKSGYTRYNRTEENVTSTLTQPHSKSDDLFPNSIYIVIATLSGTIIARQRGQFAKATLPIILGLASFKYLLPNTFDNVTAFVWGLEKEKIPYIAQQQERAVTKVDGIIQQAEETSRKGQSNIEGAFTSLKKTIANVTGLNLDEEVSKKR